jgi:uncharacterized membrane protein
MVSILRKIGAGILIIFGILFIMSGIAGSVMNLIGSLMWAIPMFLIAYFLLKEKKDKNIYSEQGTMKNEITKQTSQDRTPPSYFSPDALNILDTRYVKGEITKEQYEQMKKDLKKN